MRTAPRQPPPDGGCGLTPEFELPRGGGARPDLIFLENGTGLVVEFKNRAEVDPGALEQVLGYVAHLQDCHTGCRGRTLIPVLIPIGFSRAPRVEKKVHIRPSRGLAALIRRYSPHPADTRDWASAPHEALAALVEAARFFFERQPLPRIRVAESARLPEPIAGIEDRLQSAVEQGRRVLVLLTGVPGSGKTLAGLQVAHYRRLGTKGLFLLGNGPIIQVLRYTLSPRAAHLALRRTAPRGAPGPGRGDRPGEELPIHVPPAPEGVWEALRAAGVGG